MQMNAIPFGTTDWSPVERTEHLGETGVAYWHAREFSGIRVRMVEYLPGYKANHWCSKGHILLCIEGELHTDLRDGRVFTLRPGMSYQVADHAEAHRSYSKCGARLFASTRRRDAKPPLRRGARARPALESGRATA
jgi:hypothetical protein